VSTSNTNSVTVAARFEEAQQNPAFGVSRNTWPTVAMLAKREWVRFFRQRNRVIGAVGQPIFFWLLFGTGLHSAFQSGGQDFMTYYLPGTFALIVLFTAIFTTISVIEDRKEGFLQNVLVAPVPRWTIALGKILGGGAIALAQALMFVVLTLATGNLEFSPALFGVVAMLAVASLSLTALGFMFAWPMDSTQGFHAVMSLVLLPMWLLSGAFFPIPAPGADSGIGQILMHWLMRLNPMSYLVAGLRQMLSSQTSLNGQAVSEASTFWLPSLSFSWLISIIFLAATFVGAWWLVLRPAKGDLK
jgi:ABC-2 type transport system permease protein